MFLPHPQVKLSIVGSLRDREVACSASDLQGSNFESCVLRTVPSHSSHHSQEVILAQFSLCVHKGGLKPDSFHFISFKTQSQSSRNTNVVNNIWREYDFALTVLARNARKLIPREIKVYYSNTHHHTFSPDKGTTTKYSTHHHTLSTDEGTTL